MNENGDADIVEVDARGLLCPLPVLRLRKRLVVLSPGAVVRLLASDRMAEIDIPHFCAEAGHDLMGSEAIEGGRAYLVRRGHDTGADPVTPKIHPSSDRA